MALRRADGSQREMHPRHVVMATGVSGIPNVPDIPEPEESSPARFCIPAEYGDGETWNGKTRAS